MARTSVYSKPVPNASLPRNSFSRGFVLNLNWSAGMIVPVFCKEVPKGSHGRIDRSIFMRTASLNTAAFPKMDNHIDFFKVPLRLLMTRYEEVITNTQDANSTAVTDNYGAFSLPTVMPYFERKDVLSVLGGSQYATGYYDQLNFYQSQGAYRLLDLLGYDALNCMKAPASSPAVAGDPFECNLNAFRLMAYQKVYYDHFRNTAYESNDPRAYNADFSYLSGNSGNGYGNVKANLDKMLMIRYVNLRKDYFTNLYPALNYVSSLPNGTQWNLPSSVVGAFMYGNPGNPLLGASSITSIQSPGVISSYDGSINNRSVTVQQIRALFALDKLLRASAFAPKHVKDQIQARFGVKAKKSYGFESEYLGSFMNDIVIGEVTSTANTVGSGGQGDALGAIGGKGVSGDRGGKVIEFDTNEDDCIIMGVMYSLVRTVYDSTSIDRFNAKFVKEDYFQPEFMDLGLQPVYQYELDTVYGVNAATHNNVIRGYVPRYQEYKVSIDRNVLLFNDSRTLSIFVPHFNKTLVQYSPGSPGVNAAFFKMSPSHLDSVFVTSFQDTDISSDQFYGELQFRFDVRQNMSVHGQPRL